MYGGKVQVFEKVDIMIARFCCDDFSQLTMWGEAWSCLSSCFDGCVRSGMPALGGHGDINALAAQLGINLRVSVGMGRGLET